MNLKPMSQKEKTNPNEQNKTRIPSRRGPGNAREHRQRTPDESEHCTRRHLLSTGAGSRQCSRGAQEKEKTTANGTSEIVCRILGVCKLVSARAPQAFTNPPPPRATAQHHVHYINILTARLDVSAVLWFSLRAAHTAPQHQKHKICIWPTRFPRNGPQH